jgi:hypothetical protein
MTLRYTLNNSTEGEHICTYSPKGWEDTELVLKRHDKYDGIFKDYTVKVEFFCGAGKEYIDNIYDTQGIEAEVTVLIEVDCDDSGVFQELYDGKIIMKTYEKVQAAPEYTRVNLEQNGIMQTVLNRMETKINLSSTQTLDGTTVEEFDYKNYDLTMHSKALSFGATFEVLTASDTSTGFNNGDDIIIDIPLTPTISEISDTETVVNNYYTSGTTPYIFENNEVLTSLNLSYRIKGSLTLNATTPGAKYEIEDFWLVRGYPGLSPILYQTNSGGQFTGDYTINFDITGDETISSPDEGDQLKFYLFLQTAPPDSPDIDPDDNFPYTVTLTLDEDLTSVTLEAESIEDSTTSKASVIFETGADIARKISNQADSFRSNFFGRVDSQPYAYEENGCGSFGAITNGFQIRGFPIADKPIIMSMKEFFDGLNAIYCLGLGIKDDSGNTYIEIEPKEYFYRDEVILTFSNIRNLKTRLNEKLFFNRAEIGYKFWRKEGRNGLDEFCTKYNYSLLLKSISNNLDAVSELIAGPQTIERQRRQQYINTSTTDEEYDNNNFIICLNRSVNESNIPDGLSVAEKDENFDNIEEVLSPETIYNLRIKPARNLRNWLKILATSVIKSNDTLKDIKFSSAEGNYIIESQGTESCDPGLTSLIESSEDIELVIPNSNDSFEPLFSGEIDEFEAPLSLDDYLTLKDVDLDDVPNSFKKINYSTSDEDYLSGYIQEIRYKPIKGMATFKMLRAYDITGECSHIYVEEGYVECGYVN